MGNENNENNNKFNVIDLQDHIPLHKNRKHVYNKFLTLIQNYVSENNNNNISANLTEIDIQKFAINLERSIFNWVIKNHSSVCKTTWDDMFKHFYISRAHIIYMNLDINNSLGNTELISRLLNREIREWELCSMDSKDLFPSKWYNHLKNSGLLETEEQSTQEIADSIHKCVRCASQGRPAYKTTYYQLQTRSAKLIGWKSTLPIISWLCYWINSCSPSFII